MNAKNTPVNVISCMRYRDAQAAIGFLCDAFGFERHLVVPGESNGIAHAQLKFGNGMIMLGSYPHDGEFGKWLAPPTGPDFTNTQSIYVIVKNVDEHCARAKKAGATILIEPRDEDYGGRSYSVRDKEGYLWTFGSYDPFA